MYRYHAYLRCLYKLHRSITSISIPSAITAVWKTFPVITAGLIKRQSAQIHHALSRHTNPIALIKPIKHKFQSLSILGRSLATKSPGLFSETDQDDGKNRSEKSHSSYQRSFEMANNQDEIIAQNINNGESMENQQNVSPSRGSAKSTSRVPKFPSISTALKATSKRTSPSPFKIRFFSMHHSPRAPSFRIRHVVARPKRQQKYPRPDAKTKDLSQRSKHFSRTLQMGARNHHYVPLSDIGISSFSESKLPPNHRARILTRLRKGSIGRLREWRKSLDFKEYVKTGRLNFLSISSQKSKYISLRPFKPYKIKNIGNFLDDIDSTWLSNYAFITRQKSVMRLLPVTELSVWPRMITSDMDTQQVREIWQSMHPRVVGRHWRNYMLWALQHSPEAALKSLDIAISYSIPDIPRYIIEDCLDYLAVHFLSELSSPDPSKLDFIYRLTSTFIKSSRGDRGHYSINQRTIYLILAHCNNEQAEALYLNLCDHRISIYHFTLLHFLRRFGSTGKRSLCANVTQKIIRCRINPATNVIQKGFVKLLRSRSPRSWYRSSSFFLAELLRTGVRLNIFVYNAAISNSVEARDYDIAFNIYKIARGNGLRADAVTYRTLLKGCWESLDQENLDSVISDIESNNAIPIDDDLIFYMLYASLVIEFNRDRRSVFTNLLPLYTKYYDARPLQEIGLVNIGFSAHSFKLPFARVLCIMLIAYIRQYSQSSAILTDLYQRYWDLVMQKHPLIAPIAATDHVANSFILAFGRSLDTLDMCTTIIRSMLQHERSSLPELDSSKTYKIAGPTVYTWSILLNSFTKHGQMVAAEKVLSTMKEIGINPNDVTWNTLVNGYARAQDIDNTMHSIERMEVEGYWIDDYTLLGLRQLRDRDKLINTLNSAITNDRQAPELQDI